MKKWVVIQICLALLAFVITAWVFFKERPQAVENQRLQNELNQAKQQIQQPQPIAGPTQSEVKQSRAYLRAGVNLVHQKHFEEAIAEYDKALAIFPNDPYGVSLKGYALFRAGRIPESIEENKRAVQLDPGDPLNYIDLAKSYCAGQQFQVAEKVLLQDPPSDVTSDVNHYAATDGELRRVCKPIIPHLPRPTAKET